VFYVGKGKGNRLYHHAIRAKRVDGDSSDRLKLDRIRAVHSAGRDVGVELIRFGLDGERIAFAVEAAAIDVLKIDGNPLGANLVRGHGSNDDGYGQGHELLEDVIARLAARKVEIDPNLPVLLIRHSRAQWLDPGHDLYEKTRKWWRIGKRRENAKFAFAVYDGIARAVFRIDRWKAPGAADLEGNPDRAGRWAFVGKLDEQMTEQFRFVDVRPYLGSAGSQNPVKYVNC
jgi:hypothetical protein